MKVQVPSFFSNPRFHSVVSAPLPFVLKDIHLHSPNVRWEDIIGLEDAKRLVKEAVVYPIKVRPLPGPAGISAPVSRLRF